MTQQRDLIYIGFNRWDTIQQRSHHLAQNLSQFFRVLYVDPVAYSLPGYIYSRIRGDHSRNLRPRLRSASDNLFIFTPPPLLPLSLDNERINRIDHWLLTQMARRVMQQLEMNPSILWLTFPAHLPLVGKFGETLVCYDCMDNYPAFYSPGTIRAKLTARLEERLLLCSDLVITTAQSLQQRLQTRHAHVHLIRNAVGEQFLLSQPAEPGHPLADWPVGSGPVIGYIGSVARWLDFEAIVQMAARHPDWRILMIGPVDVDLTPYRTLPNLHFLGSKPYRKLADYVVRFDVGLIPFLLNELTLNVNPVKIYEYFALGKPVVAARLPELETFAEVCYLARGTSELVQQVETAVEELRQPTRRQLAEAQRRAIARANTWGQRTTEIVKILETHLALKQPV